MPQRAAVREFHDVDLDQIGGAAVGRAAHGQGWVLFFATDDDEPVTVAGQLFDALERHMAHCGLSRLSILLPEEHGTEALTANSFSAYPSVGYLERTMPMQRREVDLLKLVGGRILPRHLWDAVAGMSEEKTLLEERLVVPLSNRELAARFGGVPPSPTQGVTNELLKLVGDFRDGEGRLLVCATNFVRILDDAFLRHGRFDYLIPIGLPDAYARDAIWRRYVPQEAQSEIPIGDLVAASDGLTPADIEYAARRPSQQALARALSYEEDPSGQSLCAEDYFSALENTRATVSKQTVAEFSEYIEAIARL